MFLYKTIRTIDLLVNASIPALAMHLLCQTGGLNNGFLFVIAFFSVVIFWQIFFVLYGQIRYPGTTAAALLYTGLTIAQLLFVGQFDSASVAAYVYFITTLCVLSLLLFSGELFVLKSKKEVQPKQKSFLIIFLFVMSALAALFTAWISEPFWGILYEKSSWELWVFVGLFVAQVVKIFVKEAKYFSSQDPQVGKPAKELSHTPVVIVIIIAIFASMVAAAWC